MFSKERSSRLRRWLNEPLLHFLVLGALLFVVYARIERENFAEPQTIRITGGEINWLKETWTRQWHREPDEEELRGMVTDYLKELLLARAARELGLDENDTVIRRRLAQKMEFLLQDAARLSEPDEDELLRYYQSNRARYAEPARIAFIQIYFKNEASARQALQKIVGRKTNLAGDRILLEREYALTDEQTVENLFGQNFANSLVEMDKSRWQGPVASAYGYHLVWISDRQEARLSPFEAVRERVFNDWVQSGQEKQKRQFLVELSRKYELAVDDRLKPLVGRGLIE